MFIRKMGWTGSSSTGALVAANSLQPTCLVFGSRFSTGNRSRESGGFWPWEMALKVSTFLVFGSRFSTGNCSREKWGVLALRNGSQGLNIFGLWIEVLNGKPQSRKWGFLALRNGSLGLNIFGLWIEVLNRKLQSRKIGFEVSTFLVPLLIKDSHILGPLQVAQNVPNCL